MKFFCLGVILLVVFAAWSRAEGGFDLGDALDSDPTPKPKEKPKAPVKPKSGGDNEFNLEDAFTDLDPKPDKPAGKPPKSGGDGGGFNLEDAIGGMDPKPDKPVDKPKSGGGGGGKFDDSDLFGIADEKPDPDGGRSGGGRAVDPGYDSTGGADQPQEAGAGTIAAIVSAIGVAVVGAATSYFAYQKKKLCFKLQGGADPEGGKAQQDQSDPQVLSNLLRTS